MRRPASSCSSQKVVLALTYEPGNAAAARSHPPDRFCYSQNQNGPCSRRWRAGNACSRPAPAWADLQSRTAPRTAGWPAQRALQSCGTSTHRPTQPPHRKAQAHRRTRQRRRRDGRVFIKYAPIICHSHRAQHCQLPCTAPKSGRAALFVSFICGCVLHPNSLQFV